MSTLTKPESNRSRILITAIPRRFHYRITRRTVRGCGTFGFLQNGHLYPLHAHLRGGVLAFDDDILAYGEDTF